MTKTPAARKEWEAFCKLYEKGASDSQMMNFAKKMTDPKNRASALLSLGVKTPAQRKEIADRRKAIDAVTQREINLHCQFSGLPTV